MKTRLSEQFEERFIQFGIDVIKLTQKYKAVLPSSVCDQVIRSSTSIGANYSEAQNASSRADFKNKIYISKKEAAETRYWLRIITKLTSERATEHHLSEVQEILLMLQKIINTLKLKKDK